MYFVSSKKKYWFSKSSSESARNFFTKYYKLYDDDRKFNIKLFCGRALYAKGKLDYKIEKLARGADQKMKRASWQTSNAGRDDVDVNSI